jgi:CRISPR-associated protein Csm3
MSDARLKSVRQITGRIVVETGLRIGGSQETMEISGNDNPIIRNPENAEPYVPGSSLKGRMRSLAEWYYGQIPMNGDVTKPDVTSTTSRVFGKPAKQPKEDMNSTERAAYSSGPTRLIVRDALLSEDSRTAFREGRQITEVKSENSINRLTAMANPRPMERVLPGVAFDLNIAYRVFEINGDGGKTDEDLFDSVVLRALALVQADALGGGVSRGNGKVRFDNLKVDGKPVALPELNWNTAAASR